MLKGCSTFKVFEDWCQLILLNIATVAKILNETNDTSSYISTKVFPNLVAILQSIDHLYPLSSCVSVSRKSQVRATP